MKKSYLLFYVGMIIASIYVDAFNICTTQHDLFSESHLLKISLPALTGPALLYASENKQYELPHYDGNRFRSLSIALETIGAEEAVLDISNEQIVQGRIVIPANIAVQFQEKGVINIAPSSVVSIKGPVFAGRHQIFSGLGSVNISRGLVGRVYPEWWGAKRDGQSDDTRPVQAAIDSLATGGGEVAFESGTYVVDSISLTSNISIVGSGRDSVLQQKKNSKYCCSVNPVNGGTPDPKDNKRNIRIHNIHFRGTVVADGFSEHVHLLNINAATDVVVSDCWFTGWRGDGIYIGSSNKAKTERHNRDIVIKNCVFDGINNDNRNAITVIDCDELKIDNNSFSRCTRSNMPGAIDMEPNADLFSIIKNISITRNKFSNIGGGVGVIALVLSVKQKNLITPSRNILIRNNTINGLIDAGRSNGIYIMQKQDADDADSPNEITIIGNEIINSARPFLLWGVKGVIMENNAFVDSLITGLASYTKGHKSRDILFKKNIFKELGTSDGSAITVFSAENILFEDNIFENIGLSNGRNGIAINLSKGIINKIQIENNQFKGKRTTHGVKMNTSDRSNAELVDYIMQNNTFDAGIKSVSFQ